MVAWTAASQNGYSPIVGSANHTLDTTYIGAGFTETGNGLQPDSIAGLGSGLSITYIGGGFSETGQGLQPDSHVVLSSRATVTGRPGAPDQQMGERVASASHTLGTTYVGAGFTETGHGLQPDSIAGVAAGLSATYIGPGFTESGFGIQPNVQAGVGSLIPMRFFRTVTGTVRDENGNVIQDALYLIGLDNFSTLGPVESDGTFSIHLLRVEYETFILVGDGGSDEAYDLVWYESEEDQTLPATQTEIDLRFETSKPQTRGLPSGVNAALEVHFG